MLTAAEPEPEPNKRVLTTRSWAARLSSVFLGGSTAVTAADVGAHDGTKDEGLGLPDAGPASWSERSSRARDPAPRGESPARRLQSPQMVAGDTDVDATGSAASLADEERSEPSLEGDARSRAPTSAQPRHSQANSHDALQPKGRANNLPTPSPSPSPVDEQDRPQPEQQVPPSPSDGELLERQLRGAHHSRDSFSTGEPPAAASRTHSEVSSSLSEASLRRVASPRGRGWMSSWGSPMCSEALALRVVEPGDEWE
ncbi:hypothetical protein TOPH_04115 [Tolypocladium ophioglossoides CBS 100239]|uniref:Uncharacterized protein n=1 Tax=Tolypocladium ophioglossoides (strain CBS 100239) TaxID=1163406 RepID=A0A0L0NB58_TOLOC|nr:hypothetical protein TOPH_04115 [Tolypocladium ophioglossoides CBS 100239]